MDVKDNISEVFPLFSNEDAKPFILVGKMKLEQGFTADYYWHRWCKDDLLFPDSASHKHQVHTCWQQTAWGLFILHYIL